MLHETVLSQVAIFDNTCLGLRDFTTAEFNVIATFETYHPYLYNQNNALDITCDSTHNVAYLLANFSTEPYYDFVTLTDLVDNNQILRELKSQYV